MDDKAAKNLIKETFEQPYDLGRFRAFVRNLMKDYDERNTSSQIPDNFKDSIKSMYRLGKVRDVDGNEIDLLAVTLAKDTSLDRARTLQRNFIARHLSVRDKEAALVAFVSPDSDSWRFSLVRRELNLARSLKGKTKTVQDFSPARRFSFLVGKNEHTHTAQRQLVDLLKSDARPSLKTLEKAFNIEQVTEEFFEEYRKLFDHVRDVIKAYVKNHPKTAAHFAEKEIKPADFAKRLLGQIVFLYFLQKKGWLGVPLGKKWGEGSRTFLRDLYCTAEEKKLNFFHEYLQPLFYEALNRDHSDNDHYYKLFNSRIPFLNGGLFEPYLGYDWTGQAINLPDSLFHQMGSSLFGDDGKGILDVFDRYNFTVAEDEPLEREVAIDPEMLGKVFEKLLPVKDRGKLGTFYTPREIVHYMCQESLIAYLASHFPALDKTELDDFIRYGDLLMEHDSKILREGVSETYKDFFLGSTIRANLKAIDEALKTVKVCDPAVGSGAFPVGMMSEIVRARKVLAVHLRQERQNYDLKRETIQECLYGVDLDPGAIEIAKLRLWLSLVVDEDNFDQIQALPNLDYKIMQGNSLLQSYEGIKLFEDTLLMQHDHTIRRKAQLETELKSLETTRITLQTNASFAMSPTQKNALQKEIEQKNKQIATLDVAKTQEDAPLFAQASKALELAERLKRLHAEFFNTDRPKNKKELKTEIEALEWQLIEASLRAKDKDDKIPEIQKLQRHNVKPYFLWKLHFNEVFTGDNSGFDIVIANPPYIKEYGNKLAFDGTRDSPYYQGKMDLWYFFGAIGLDLLKAQGIQCYIAPNNWVTNAGASKLRTKIITDSQILRFIDFGDYMVFDSASIQTMIYVLQKAFTPENYDFEFRKIFLKKPTSDQLKDFLYAQIPAPDCDIFSVQIERQQNSSGYLSFVKSDFQSALDSMVAAENITFLQENEIAQGIVMPQDFVSKKHMVSYPDLKKGDGIFNITHEEKEATNWTDLELTRIKPFYTTKELGKYYGNSANELWVLYMGSDANRVIHDYPNIKNHLDCYRDIITSDFAPYGLHRARDERFFTGEKIASVRKCALPSFTYTDFDCYVSQTHFVIKTDRFDMKYLTGVLNSKAVAYWLKHKGKMQGSNYQVDKAPLVQIPLPQAPAAQQMIIAKWITTILDQKKQNPDADVSALEAAINAEVYKLYHLTEAEIAIIENADDKKISPQ